MGEKFLKLEDLGLPKTGQALYQELINLQEKMKTKQVVPKGQINQEIVDELLETGEPLIDKIPPQITNDVFQETIRHICQIYARYVPERKKEIKAIMNLRSQLVADIDAESFQSKHPEISGNLLALILENAYRPYFLALAEKLRDYTDLENWRKNYCPVCGQKASLATLNEEDKQRVLWCTYCSTGWPFMRLACLDCDNRNHEELKLFYLADDKGFQIHVCEKCKSYIKAVRRGLVKPENLPLIDAQTASLDLLAEQEGYHKQKLM